MNTVEIMQAAVANLILLPANHPAWSESYRLLPEFMAEIEKEHAEYGERQ